MKITSAIGMLVVALVLTGCQDSESAAAGQGYPSTPVTMTAGANPGSGFDLTIRSVVDALQKEGIVGVPVPVQNRPGASGADFLATMVEQYRGDDHQVSVTSLSMMMNELRGQSKYGYDDVTMIARLMTEYYVVVTAPDSAFKNLDDVMTAIKSDPARVAVGAAHDDEAPFDLLVSAAGGDPSSVHYVTHEGGGDQSAALGRGDISVAIGGFVVAYRQKALGRMVESPTWKQIAERSQFTTTFMIGAEFQSFLAKTRADVKTALEEAGQ